MASVARHISLYHNCRASYKTHILFPQNVFAKKVFFYYWNNQKDSLTAYIYIYIKQTNFILLYCCYWCHCLGPLTRWLLSRWTERSRCHVCEESAFFTDAPAGTWGNTWWVMCLYRTLEPGENLPKAIHIKKWTYLLLSDLILCGSGWKD